MRSPRVQYAAPVRRARVLTIAGSDPSGGAGIQCDIKTIHQHRVYAEAVPTLITVQNTRGVSAVHVLDAELVAAQVRALFEDGPADVIKTGALGSAAVVRAIAALLVEVAAPLVVDFDPPVLGSGAEASADAFKTVPRLGACNSPNLVMNTTNIFFYFLHFSLLHQYH